MPTQLFNDHGPEVERNPRDRRNICTQLMYASGKSVMRNRYSVRMTCTDVTRDGCSAPSDPSRVTGATARGNTRATRESR